MSHAATVLGVDVGTSHCSVLALDTADSSVLGIAREPIGTRRPKRGWAEQGSLDWWSAFEAALRGVAARIDVNGVVAIGVSSHLEAWVPLDKQGKELHPGILWFDLRTADLAANLAATLATPHPEQVTGVRCDYLTPAVKIAWMRTELGRDWERVKLLLAPKDLLVHKLTGETTTDRTVASKTMLYDTRGNTGWSRGLLHDFGLDASLMPRVAESTEVVGRVSRRAGEALGLPAGIPVVAGAGDDHTLAVGGGAVRPGDVQIGASTSGQVTCILDHFAVPVDGAECHAYVEQDRWCYWLSVGVVGQYVDWFCEAVLGATPATAEARARVSELAASAPRGADGLIFLPFLWGARFPIPVPKASGGFLGLRPQHGIPHLARAVLESVAYMYRYALTLIDDLDGATRMPLVMLGGATKSPLFCQIVAEVLEAPIAVPEATEGSALGAAILAAVGIGIFRSIPDAVDALVRMGGTYSPTHRGGSIYSAGFERFDVEARRYLAAVC